PLGKKVGARQLSPFPPRSDLRRRQSIRPQSRRLVHQPKNPVLRRRLRPTIPLLLRRALNVAPCVRPKRSKFVAGVVPVGRRSPPQSLHTRRGCCPVQARTAGRCSPFPLAAPHAPTRARSSTAPAVSWARTVPRQRPCHFRPCTPARLPLAPILRRVRPCARAHP